MSSNPGTTKKEIPAAKKRSRDEREEDDINNGLDMKRQNTSKTPVKPSKDGTTSHPTPMTTNGSTKTTKVSKPVTAAVPKTKTVPPVTDMVPPKDLLLPPSPQTSSSIVASTTLTTKTLAGKTTTKEQETLENIPPVNGNVVPSATTSTTPTTVSGNVGAHRSLKKWVAFLAFLLVIFSGMAIFVYVSSEVVIMNLKQELSQCRVTMSEQDSYYVQELQSQVVAWKRRVAEKESQLKSLHEECSPLGK